VLTGGPNNTQIIYLADFSHAKEYRDPRTNAHICYRQNLAFTGTPNFASINTHLGIEASRRDDIESLAYMLIYLLKGSLPWQTAVVSTECAVLQIKQSTSVEQLCHLLPPEYKTFLEYSRELTFHQKPDYAYLRQLFRSSGAEISDKDAPLFDLIHTSPTPIRSPVLATPTRKRCAAVPPKTYVNDLSCYTS
jgi:hypothetical protein